MSRKDSKGMFANVLGKLGEGAAEAATPAAASTPAVGQPAKPLASPHLMKVAAGVRQIQERGELIDKLMKEGGQVLELDPDAVLPSALADRFEGAYDDTAISELVISMADRGQIVPGLVRPAPGEPQRYQIVYGRRRLAAAKKLGLKFKAVVRELSDEQAVIYQGEENTARNDLTFIEKCAFALTMEKAGYSRNTIAASLSTGKSHISEMIRLASTLPDKLVRTIGPAPDIGRRRWIELMEKWITHQHSHVMVQEVLDFAGKNMTSEERFALAMSSMFVKALKPAPKDPGPLEVVSRGIKLVDVAYGKAGGKMVFSKSVPADFVAYLAERMEELHDAYHKDASRRNEQKRS
jgi:ParB family transcriptional regulator, chromosome partitioning protein